MIKNSLKVFLITICLSLTNTYYADYRCFNCAIAAPRSNTSTSSLTAKTIARRQQDFSQASLWWAIEQFDPFEGRLIESWTSHGRMKEITLTVNLQLWTLMDYLGRYSFVNQFGTTVRNQGYNLSIFSTKKQRLATYKYNPETVPPKWEITLERLGKDSLRLTPENN